MAQARMGSAASYRSGVIESIDVTAEIAVLRCDDGVVRQVRTSVMPAKGLIPEVGERWMLDFKYGHWIFGAIVGWSGVVEGTPGPPGPTGPAGPPGSAGPGGTGGGTYLHNQMIASASWHIVHNLGGYPAVVVIDSAGTEQEGDIHFNSTNDLTVTFSAAFAGTANLIL